MRVEGGGGGVGDVKIKNKSGAGRFWLIRQIWGAEGRSKFDSVEFSLWGGGKSRSDILLF